MKPIRFFLWMALSVALCFGCRQGSSAPPPASANLPTDTVARIHWLGKSRLSSEQNAAGFMRIWNQPESAALETQTLDRLSSAPWRLLRGEAGTNAAAARLRPLLDDLIQEETYLEVIRRTNQPGALALAIHLNDARAALWETNLAAVLESLTGIRPDAAPGSRRGWSLTKHHPPNRLELTREGVWTIIGAGEGTNPLVDDFVARIRRDHAPFTRPTTNFWLEANVDLPEFSRALSLNWDLPTNVPKLFLTLTGDGQNVLTRGELTLPAGFPLALEPWQLPTNLIHVVLGSFTALRGVGPWLGTTKAWRDLQIGPPPNQFFVWSSSVIPLQTLFAAAVPDASNRMSQLNTILLSRVSPWLATNGSGRLDRAQDSDGLIWTTVPYMSPGLHSEGNFICGGFFPSGGLKPGLPDELVRVLGQTNLVYYDWELTGPRIQNLLQLSQLVRVVLHRAQLPVPSASLAFLQANTNRLGNSVTIVSRTAPGRLSFVRQSGVGLTAAEMHLLADWLESPRFPLGLNSLLGPGDFLRDRKLPRPVLNQSQ